VSANSRITVMLSSTCSSRAPAPLSSAANRAAWAIRSSGASAASGSLSRCVIWPQPTSTGVCSSSSACARPGPLIGPSRGAAEERGPSLKSSLAITTAWACADKSRNSASLKPSARLATPRL
jgi:hypothetical protein